MLAFYSHIFSPGPFWWGFHVFVHVFCYRRSLLVIIHWRPSLCELRIFYFSWSDGRLMQIWHRHNILLNTLSWYFRHSTLWFHQCLHIYYTLMTDLCIILAILSSWLLWELVIMVLSAVILRNMICSLERRFTYIWVGLFLCHWTGEFNLVSIYTVVFSLKKYRGRWLVWYYNQIDPWGIVDRSWKERVMTPTGSSWLKNIDPLGVIARSWQEREMTPKDLAGWKIQTKHCTRNHLR